MNGQRLESVDTEKDMGVMVSNDLKVHNSVIRHAIRQLGCWE